MDNTGARPLILWGITDGRAGHIAQLKGLMAALSHRRSCESFELPAPSLSAALPDVFLRRARFAGTLPDPDFIIGAGHATHLPVIAARRARGGRSVILMRPSLPLRCFDICIIPEHDRVPEENNVMVSRGPVNNVIPARQRRADQGLILVGGPSRHFRRDDDALLEQIRAVTGSDPRRWLITDSPRTPAAMSSALAKLAGPGCEYHPWRDCPAGWLVERLGESDTVWVSEDSMSMVYEALSGGARVGLLEVPAARASRLARATAKLAQAGDVTRFRDWRGGPLPLPRRSFNEAERCAKELLERFALQSS